MEFDLYGDDSKGVVKLDPRTKLLVFIASSILSWNLYNEVATVLYSLSLCLLLGLCGKRALALKAAALLLVLVYLRWCMFLQGSGLGVVLAIMQVLITVFLFAFPVVGSLLLLVQTTRVSQFLAAFSAMRLPATVVIPVAVMFRFMPTVQDEWTGIRKAMAFRGMKMDLASVARHPFQSVEHMLVPLLLSSVSVMDELAAAAEARGLDADHARTSYEEARLHAPDVVIIAAIACLAVYVAVHSFLGVGL